MSNIKPIDSTEESNSCISKCIRQKKEVNIYNMNSSNQYNNDLGKYFDKFMFNSFVLPDKQPKSLRVDKIDKQIIQSTNKSQKTKSEKKMKFPMPLFEIERQTTFVNTNFHKTKIEYNKKNTNIIA